MEKNIKKISIIVPAYNEEEVIPYFYKEILDVFDTIKNEYDYELIFIDDGSTDNTLNEIKKLRENDKKINIISFSRNFGKDSAMLAGLQKSSGELIVIIDADLQHDPTIMLTMIQHIKEGYDVVATVRNRKGESIIKSAFSGLFYNTMKTSKDIELEKNEQDYRMMTRQVVDSILKLNEYNRFSRGIFNWVGFKTKKIYVENRLRIYGKTKWNFRKLVKYSMDGITSFTEKPLKIATIGGSIISFLSLVLGIIICIQTLIMGKDVPGYASTITSVLFIGGIQLISIGILSEYIGKIYMEVKKRPQYIIKEEFFEKNDRG